MRLSGIKQNKEIMKRPRWLRFVLFLRRVHIQPIKFHSKLIAWSYVQNRRLVTFQINHHMIWISSQQGCKHSPKLSLIFRNRLVFLVRYVYVIFKFATIWPQRILPETRTFNPEYSHSRDQHPWTFIGQFLFSWQECFFFRRLLVQQMFDFLGIFLLISFWMSSGH